MNKPKTNVERVTEFMNFGSPLNQIFIMESVRRHVEDILLNADAVRAAMKDSFINADAWIQCAQEWKKQNP